ncbi:acetylornithine deacetylase [Sagittula marina]|uniref:Acetylornithine deacetylase n=1 Tax=Sagittula marina TaxID=943940 RepID=A0A7W6DQU9_9RHOB|nr:acetylornithine deacetylase [Sagittula marina]MBB3984358.1 acetylornithine deacetylase [Sagittula marina]
MTTEDILAQLIAFPTVSADSNLPLIDWVEDFLHARGFTVHRVMDSTGQKAGLFAALGPSGPGGVMLSAHSDVVPVTGQDWTRDPFRLTREGNQLFGRGTTDMKGFLAAMLHLADRAAGQTLTEPLKLAISYDEEVGCRGIAQMMPHLEETIGLPRLCIVGEPTGMAIAHGHKGKAAYRATCHGEAGHSAMAPRFSNALHLGADLVRALRDVQADLSATGPQDQGFATPCSTIHVGKMWGGTALNIVPDLCTLEFEVRHLATDPLDRIEQRIRDAAHHIVDAAGPSARIAITQENLYPGLSLPPTHPAIAAVSAWLNEAPLMKVDYGTEAGHFDLAGVPTLVCGPGHMDQGHTADEFITTDQLAACDAMLARVLNTLQDMYPKMQ